MRDQTKIPNIEPEKRLCWWCKHFQYSSAEHDWSEVTPGSDWNMYCAKSIWEFDTYKSSQADFAKCLSAAKTCSDFVPLENLI
jgi:hypothetical protein